MCVAPCCPFLCSSSLLLLSVLPSFLSSTCLLSSFSPSIEVAELGMINKFHRRRFAKALFELKSKVPSVATVDASSSSFGLPHPPRSAWGPAVSASSSSPQQLQPASPVHPQTLTMSASPQLQQQDRDSALAATCHPQRCILDRPNGLPRPLSFLLFFLSSFAFLPSSSLSLPLTDLFTHLQNSSLVPCHLPQSVDVLCVGQGQDRSFRS